MNMDINVLSKDNFYVSVSFTTTEIGNLSSELCVNVQPPKYRYLEYNRHLHS